MIILRQRIFSNREGEKKISAWDKANISSTKLDLKYNRRIEGDIFGENEEKANAAIDKSAKLGAVGGALIGAGSGALIGKYNIRGSRAGRGALIGATVGSAGMYALNKLRGKAIRKLRKKSEGYRKMADKGSDYYKVGAGDMTKEEFAKKWGK